MALSCGTCAVSGTEEQGCTEVDCLDIPPEIISERLHQFYKSIVESLNTSQLNILLVQQNLLTAKEANDYCSAKVLIEVIDNIGLDGYGELYLCICQEKEHMGHHYIQAILENRVYAPQEEVEHSTTMKYKLNRNLKVLEACDLKELIKFMYSKCLLTCQEWRKLHAQTSDAGNELLISIAAILDTKGPLAYSIFAECLQNIDCSVYAQIFNTGIDEPRKPQKRRLEQTVAQASPNKKLPPKMKLCGCLRSSRYKRIMKVFQQCHHNGEWDKLEAEVKVLMTRGTATELQAVAYLECAISWVFRKDENKVLDFVAKARQLLQNDDVNDDNATILDGRCEYILSRLYRYLQQYDKAQEHIIKATYVLKWVEAGEDTAFLHYCDASIRVERLSNNHTTNDISFAQMSYEYAVDHARSHDTGLDLVAPHSFIRLAQMHLRSNHNFAGSQRETKSIDSARNCLAQIDPSSLSQRSKCHYLLIRSDLNRCQQDLGEASVAVKKALELAQAHKFTTETIAAKQRLHSNNTFS